MGRKSISKKYIPKSFEQGALLNSIQTVFEVNAVNYSELRIMAEFKYDDGINERKDLNLDEVKDIRCIDNQPKRLFFYTENLSFSFTKMFDDLLIIEIASNAVETLKSALDIFEKLLSLQRVEYQNKIETKTEISEDLIKKLINDGERLTNKDNDNGDTTFTIRRKAMSDKIKPELKPQLVNVEMFCENTPEKLELLDGVLLGDIEESKKLLLLLLYNIGLEETVKLAPKELWEQAIDTLHE